MEQQRIREKNVETIQKFLECTGPGRGTARAPLFTPDARKEMELTIQGKKELQNIPASEWLELSARMFPEWGFYENTIFHCEDPNLFLVKSRGKGYQIKNEEQIPVDRFYINEFVMRDGLICRFRETANPCEALHSGDKTMQEDLS